MHIITVEKQRSDELSDIASTASSNEFETGTLLPGVTSRPDTGEEVQKPSDQEAWYQQPKQECFRQVVLRKTAACAAIPEILKQT